MAEVTEVKLSEVTPDSKNANLGTPAGMSMLENSLRKHGAGRSILLDKKRRIIAGNKTAEQAGSIGLDDLILVETDGTKLVAVLRTDLDLDDPATGARALAYADNRVAEVDLVWNPDQLLADQDLVTREGLWTKNELDLLLAQVGPPDGNGGEPGEMTETEADKLAKAYGVKEGQIWRLGDHTIACLDSLKAENIKTLVGDLQVGFIWSDPPYGLAIVAAHGFVGGGELYGIPYGGVKNATKGLGSIGRTKPFGSWRDHVCGSVGTANMIPIGKYAPIVGDDTTETAKASFDLLYSLYPKATHVWWGGNYYTDILPPSPGWIVWDKDNTGNFADCELAWTNQNRAARIFEHRWNGMLKASEQGQRRVHPTQKPVMLALECLKELSQPRDIIIDPFLGSGISVLAAQRLDEGHKVFGFELVPAYIGVTIHRWEQETGQKAALWGINA